MHRHENSLFLFGGSTAHVVRRRHPSLACQVIAPKLSGQLQRKIPPPLKRPQMISANRRSVKRCSRNAIPSGNIGYLYLRISEKSSYLTYLTIIQRRLASTVSPTGTSRSQPCTSSLSNEVALELRQGSEHVKDQLTGSAGGFDSFGHGFEGHPFPLQATDNPNQVGQRTTEAVQSPDNQSVTTTQSF